MNDLTDLKLRILQIAIVVLALVFLVSCVSPAAVSN